MSGRLSRQAVHALGALAFLVLAPAPAHAHLVQTGFGAFYDGIAHVLLTPADLLVVLALAFFAGLRGQEVARTALFALPAAWLAGALAGAWLPAAGALPASWSGGLSVMVWGALVATDARLPRAAAVSLGAVALALHGAASAATAPGAGLELLALVGSAGAIFTLVTLGGALVVSRRAGWPRIAVRVVGSWIAAIGLLMLAWSWRTPS